MDALEYFKIKNRMTDNCKKSCWNCLLYSRLNSYHCNCGDFESNHTEEAIETIKRWNENNPEYTAEQKEAFKALKTLGFNYIAMNENEELMAYVFKPNKNMHTWYVEGNVADLDTPYLDFIKWEDTEPFKIPEV